MRCDTCGNHYPSKYYFRGSTHTCTDCYNALPAEEKLKPDYIESAEKFDSWTDSANRVKWWTFASSMVLLVTGEWGIGNYPRDTNPIVSMLLLISLLTTPMLSLLTLPKWQSVLGVLVVIYIVLLGASA